MAREQAQINAKLTTALESISARVDGMDVDVSNQGQAIAGHKEAIDNLKDRMKSVLQEAYRKA